jgi:hypothetical protein
VTDLDSDLDLTIDMGDILRLMMSIVRFLDGHLFGLSFFSIFVALYNIYCASNASKIPRVRCSCLFYQGMVGRRLALVGFFSKQASAINFGQ